MFPFLIYAHLVAEPPANLSEYDITISSFSVEWVEPFDPNGVIVAYYIELSIEGTFLQDKNVSNTTFNATFTGLKPVIRYNVSVCAWTINCGENFTITVLTDGSKSAMIIVCTCNSCGAGKLASNVFWLLGGFESNPPIFQPPNCFHNIIMAEGAPNHQI